MKINFTKNVYCFKLHKTLENKNLIIHKTRKLSGKRNRNSLKKNTYKTFYS